MRVQHLFAALGVLALAGCQVDNVDLDGDKVAFGEHELTNPTAALDPKYDPVAAIKVLLPLPEDPPDGAVREDFRFCSGVLIEERTVLTSARCIAANVEAEEDPEITDPHLDATSVQIAFGFDTGAIFDTQDAFTLDLDDPGVPNGVFLHRYFDDEINAVNEIAVLRLSESPGITPVTLHTDALADNLVGMDIELVGYGSDGNAGDANEEFDTRGFQVLPIDSVSNTRIEAGSDDDTSCFADSGGPGFVDFGNGPELVSINVFHGACRGNVARQRVDIHAADFLVPFINRFSGPCPQDGTCSTEGCEALAPDPDCDDCSLNGVCKEDCGTRDWDCELGSFTGEACEADGECEENGTCIAAIDDEVFTYCARPCEAGANDDCPNGMECSANGRCEYVAPSPGSQGAACSLAGDCRSGFCENQLCANECDQNDPNACDDGFFCLPSETDGTTTVCRTEQLTGGAGFCSVGPNGSAEGGRNGFLAGFGLVLFVGLFRRRRA